MTALSDKMLSPLSSMSELRAPRFLRLGLSLCSSVLILNLTAVSCEREDTGYREVCLSLETGSPQTRSSDPRSDVISDVNLFVYRTDGTLEDNIWLQAGSLERGQDVCRCPLRILDGITYDIYVLANLGYRLKPVPREELREFRFHLSRPDEFVGGVPMSGRAEEVRVDASGTIPVRMVRAVARVSLRVDRRGLDRDVSFTVTGASAGGCPRSVSMFEDSRAASEDDVFSTGFRKGSSEVSGLNANLSGGVSEPVDLWLLENLQGDVFKGISSRRDRVMQESDPLSRLCSYVEVTGIYDSDSLYSLPGSHLTYRFYLGESVTDCSVRRNSHYNVTLVPEGSGLDGGGWRIDRGEMSVHWKGQPWFKFWPADYIEGRIGDRIRVWCDYYPPDTPFDIGLEELEYDHGRGIYDYAVDPDGKGVTLTLTGKGTGILYPSASAPINQSAMIMIVCEP